MRTVILISLVLLTSLAVYVFQNIQVEVVAPPTIEIYIGPEIYSSENLKSKDIVELAIEMRNSKGQDAGIVLFANNTVQYERVNQAMNQLKENGFTVVSLGSE